MASKTVQVGGEQIRLEAFSGRKAIRVIRTIEHITKGVPEILDRWAQFTREYEASHVTELDRAMARVEYAPRPLMDEEPLLDGEGRAITDQLGQALVRRTPKLIDGVPVMGPDPLGHMSEEDWQASGNRLRIPRSPSTEERVAAIFPMALTLAETEVSHLLALLSMSNADVKRAAAGDFPEALEQRAEELMDAPAEDLMELAVAAGEMVEEQFMAKVKGLGDRLPNALRLFGMSPKGQASTNSASETNPISSTDSPSPTDGESDELSTAPSGDGSPISASV
jgi:hypothetical protein